MKKTSKKIKTNALYKNLVGKPVIVRANTAGVHAGQVVAFDPATKSILLSNACRLWRVYTRDNTGSVSDVAANGLKLPLNQHSIGAKLDEVLIVNNEGLEIAIMTPEAYNSVLSAAPDNK